MTWHVALTGTPGSGKTRVALELRGRPPSIEVGPLAERFGASTTHGRGWTVDLPRLRRGLRSRGAVEPLWVGHLAHLLPVRAAIVLRCHPRRLLDRLERSARPLARRLREENAAAEALAVVTREALRPGVRVWELDTTDRSVPEVARAVRRLLQDRPAPRYGRIDWLRDPSVASALPGWTRGSAR
ncbi:MAG: adenylate kinase family protein [Thermoplasmata archaeon]